ncbi:uncharacterized mitochondrial protein AtMg00820-like [Carya illinoinensis]|uniref:uncharacterized mitochondrial protein AtMg00820-like n=1 Tax=Carya illinoinensis TaxID=32201 RepID=UPI001C727880|nr:uncharacterized mitochondrial protein AtMg00820-like [Carya illinoinensis]
MHDKLQALRVNNTWNLIPCEATVSIIACQWVFKIKLKANGTLDMPKDCVVAKGFNQEDGINYHETFSPVIKPSIILIVITLALINYWSISQLDVKNAFLHSDLYESFFMEQLSGIAYKTHEFPSLAAEHQSTKHSTDSSSIAPKAQN